MDIKGQKQQMMKAGWSVGVPVSGTFPGTDVLAVGGGGGGASYRPFARVFRVVMRLIASTLGRFW